MYKSLEQSDHSATCFPKVPDVNTSPIELKPTINKHIFKFDKWIFGKGRPNLRELLLEAIKNRRIRMGSPAVFTRPTSPDTFQKNPGYGKFFSWIFVTFMHALTV